MTKVAVFRDETEEGGATYRAVAGRSQSMGRTAGEAVDALAAELSGEEAETLIIVRDLRPDRHFAAGPRRRLEQLMARWREARDAGAAPPPEDRAELERLVDAEVRAAGERAAALRDELAR